MTGTAGIGLAAGLLSALMFLSLSQGVAIGLLPSYLAPLPLMMAGLWRGAGTAGLAGVAAMIAIGLVSGEGAVLPFGLAVVAPSVIVARQALLWRTTPNGTVEWYPPGLVLGWLTGLAVALIVIGGALVLGQQVEVGTETGGGVREWVAASVGRMLETLAPGADAIQRQTLVDQWVAFFPALLAGSWLAMILINATTAQALLVRMGRNRRPSPGYREMELPSWLAVVLVAGATAGIIGEGDLAYLGRSIAVVALVPFVLLGLAGIHGWAAGRPNARMLLVAVYGVLFLASAWALLPVAGLGLVRFVTRFRTAGDSGGGKEE